jgi:hypothetical protein
VVSRSSNCFIVIAIMALIASGVGVAAYLHYERVKKKHARIMVGEIRHAVKAYWLDHPPECPTVPELIDAGIIDEDFRVTDPWGSSWDVQCSAPRIVVSSRGPDREAGTDDDIVAPDRDHRDG